MWSTRCPHSWKESGRSYVQPSRTGRIKIDDLMEFGVDRFQQMVQGGTSVELRCEHCGDIKEVRMIGDHT